MSRTTPLFFVVIAVVALGAAGVSAQPYEMHGSGTTNPSKFFWKVMDLLEERARAPVSLTYRAVGKGPGRGGGATRFVTPYENRAGGGDNFPF